MVAKRCIPLVSLMLLLANWALAAGPEFKPLLFEVKANENFTVKLRDLLTDPNYPGKLDWEIKENPQWIRLDLKDEKLIAQPGILDAGVHSFKMSVYADEGGQIDVSAKMTVHAPPKWSVTNPLNLGIQPERKLWTYSKNLKDLVSDPSGPPTITIKGMPEWMTYQNGVLSGTPQRVHVGKYSGIQITASGKGGDSTIEAIGEVELVVQPPSWTANEIDLPEAFEDLGYSVSVTQYALNPEGTPLTYELVTQIPPPWVEVGASGNLFGTPHKPHLGTTAIRVVLKTKIFGKDYDATTTFKIKVNHVNHAPEWLSDLITLPPGTAKIPYTQNLSSSVKDIDDNDKLTFKIIDAQGIGAPWATIGADSGVIGGLPQKENIGEHTFTVTVVDKEGLSDTTTVKIKILKGNEPPYWKNNPTVLPSAEEDSSYNMDLGGYVEDPDGDTPLTFLKIDGPSWISVSSSGALQGTPKMGDIGLHKFHVRVSDNISGSALGEIQILVAHVNHPPEWLLNPITSKTKEDASMSFSIKGYAIDKDVPLGDTLKFSVFEGKPWAQLSTDGVFTGTPGHDDLGKNEYRVRVMDKEGAWAETLVIIEVLPVNHKPSWLKNPIQLSNAKEDAPYTASVSEYATDPDLPNDQLRFFKVSGPNWLSVSQSGAVSGTPTNHGTSTFEVRVMDKAGESAVASVHIFVEKVNHCPYWKQVPLQMAPAKENTEYGLNLAKYAQDDDGDTLYFKLVSYQGPGSSWIFVNTNGEIKGVPLADNVGAYTAKFSVTDSECDAEVEGKGIVENKNIPPIISPNLPVIEVLEDVVFAFNPPKGLNDPQYVSDPDKDPIHFELQPKFGQDASWVALDRDGKLTLSPLYKHIGYHEFRFKVDDNTLPSYGVLKIKVLRNASPPVWFGVPIQMQAKANEPFHNTLADKAKDLDGVPLTFKKIDGPNWLAVASDGTLSGLPTNSNLGPNEFTVSACNDQLCKDAKLIIQVLPGIQKDEWQVDAKVPGARAENVWVIDHSFHCHSTIRLLRKHIGVFFNQLRNAEIHYTEVLISADAHKFGGAPLTDKSGRLILPWTIENPILNFEERLDNSASFDKCGNCYNSPLFSMFRLYERAPTSDLNEIYHKSFWMAGIPSDALIVTHQKDHYKTFTKKIPAMKDWTAIDFAQKSFIPFHIQEQQPYRVNAIAPEFGSLTENSGDLESFVAENAYRVVVDQTQGTYWVVPHHGSFDMATALREYATQIIRRAYIHAKREVTLSKVPIDTSTIKVTIGGVTLSNDKWQYIPGTPSKVRIRWELINEGQLKPGDKIVIEYRVS